jgi:hypothetical protein
MDALMQEWVRMGDAMLRIVKFGMLYGALATVFASVPALEAQQAKETPTAPVPVQILTAKKVFISNASGECGVSYCPVPSQPYNEFYAVVKSWGRYEIVSTPAAADLVFEIHFTPIPQVGLVILDPETRITLWTFVELVHPASRPATGRKNFDKAMTTLVDDVKKLVTPSAADAPN